MIANLLKSDSAAGKLENATPQLKPASAAAAAPPASTPPPTKAAKNNSVAAAVAASSHDEDELYGVTDIVSFITGSNL